MAAPSYVFAIARVAKLLNGPEALFQDIAMDMEPEDGFPSWNSTMYPPSLLHRRGIENLKELLEDRKSCVMLPRMLRLLIRENNELRLL